MLLLRDFTDHQILHTRLVFHRTSIAKVKTIFPDFLMLSYPVPLKDIAKVNNISVNVYSIAESKEKKTKKNCDDESEEGEQKRKHIRWGKVCKRRRCEFIDDEAVLSGDDDEDGDDGDIEEDGNVADLIDDDVIIEDDHGLLIEYGPKCHIVKLPISMIRPFPLVNNSHITLYPQLEIIWKVSKSLRKY